MKVNINTKNHKLSTNFKDTIEDKLEKISKFFSDDIEVNVMISKEKELEKFEATVIGKGVTFRSEEVAHDLHDAMDKAIDRLRTQMQKHKGKLQKKYKGNKSIKFENFDVEEDTQDDSTEVVKTKVVNVVPITVEEAILEMEMTHHDFYVFENANTRELNVIYKRKDDNYGVLEINI